MTHIAEILGMDLNGQYKTQDIYRFYQTGKAADGTILGELRPTGILPTFMEAIELNHLPFPKELFLKGKKSPKKEDSAA